MIDEGLFTMLYEYSILDEFQVSTFTKKVLCA